VLAKDLKPGMMFLEPCTHMDPACKCSECVLWTVISVSVKHKLWFENENVPIYEVTYVTGRDTVETLHYSEHEPAWDDSELVARKS
jgi:hypothetical protein